MCFVQIYAAKDYQSAVIMCGYYWTMWNVFKQHLESVGLCWSIGCSITQAHAIHQSTFVAACFVT